MVYKDKDDKLLWFIRIKMTSCSLVVYKDKDYKVFSCGL